MFKALDAYYTKYNIKFDKWHDKVFEPVLKKISKIKFIGNFLVVLFSLGVIFCNFGFATWWEYVGRARWIAGTLEENRQQVTNNWERDGF